MKIKYIAIFLVLLCCFMGAASAADDVSIDAVDASVDDAVAVDAVSEDIGDSVTDDPILSEDTTTEEINEATIEKENKDIEQTRGVSQNASTWGDLRKYSQKTDANYDITLTDDMDIGDSIEFGNSATIIGSPNCYITGTSSDIVFTSTGDLNIKFVNVTFRDITTSDVLIKLSTSGVNTFENCNFSNIYTDAPDNHSSVIWNYGGLMNITNCSFSDCNNSFGVVTNHKTATSVTMNVDKCKFENNYARTEPGAINNCGILSVTDSEFNNNSAFWWGGAIHTHYNARTTIHRCNFTDNDAGWNGGALYTYSILNVYDSIFKRNKCHETTGGGAIGASNWWMGNYNITIENCTFEENENCNPAGSGGAITAMNSGALNVHNSTFINNTAHTGQAISAYSKKFENISAGIPNLKVYNNTFYNHTLTNTDTVEISGNYTFENNSFYRCHQVNQGTNNHFYYPVSLNNPVSPSISTKNALGVSNENILQVSPSEINIGPTTDAIYDAIDAIANNGIIYLSAGTYNDDWNDAKKNYTLIGEDNTVIVRTKLTEGNNGTHTFINLIFQCNQLLKINNQRNDAEKIFINCIFKVGSFTISNGNDVEESTGLLKFENCIFEDCNSFIDIGRHINATFTNCTFKNIEADSLIKITSDLVQYVNLTECTFENCVMNGVVNLPMDTDVTDYVAIEDCTYDFDATTDVIASEDNENHYVNATKLKSTPVDSAVDISSSEKGVVVVTLTDKDSNAIAGATFKYTVNGGDEQTAVTGDDGKYAITGLTGEVTVAVNYEGNESYNAISDSKFFNFTEEPVVPPKVATKITAPKVTATYNVAKKLVITLTDKDGKALANKKVTVKVGTISKTLTTNAKGQVSLNVATLVPKTYTATVKFAGDDSYIASSVSPKVVVSKAKPQIVAKAKTFKVKTKTKKYTVTLKNNKGKVMKKVKLTLKVGKKTYKATTNSKGKATFKITKLTKKGKYTATIKFAGSKYYKALSKKAKITVKK